MSYTLTPLETVLQRLSNLYIDRGRNPLPYDEINELKSELSDEFAGLSRKESFIADFSDYLTTLTGWAGGGVRHWLVDAAKREILQAYVERAFVGHFERYSFLANARWDKYNALSAEFAMAEEARELLQEAVRLSTTASVAVDGPDCFHDLTSAFMKLILKIPCNLAGLSSAVNPEERPYTMLHFLEACGPRLIDAVQGIRLAPYLRNEIHDRTTHRTDAPRVDARNLRRTIAHFVPVAAGAEESAWYTVNGRDYVPDFVVEEQVSLSTDSGENRFIKGCISTFLNAATEALSLASYMYEKDDELPRALERVRAQLNRTASSAWFRDVPESHEFPAESTVFETRKHYGQIAELHAKYKLLLTMPAEELEIPLSSMNMREIHDRWLWLELADWLGMNRAFGRVILTPPDTCESGNDIPMAHYTQSSCILVAANVRDSAETEYMLKCRGKTVAAFHVKPESLSADALRQLYELESESASPLQVFVVHSRKSIDTVLTLLRPVLGGTLTLPQQRSVAVVYLAPDRRELYAYTPSDGSHV